VKSNIDNIEIIFSEGNKKDAKAKYAVIVSRYNGKWVFCRHKDRTTYEVPGGHIEKGETPDDAAKRELYEETGATDFCIKRVCIYGVKFKGQTNYGVLYFADINVLGDLPDSEIVETILLDSLPNNLTYPHIQPNLFEYVNNFLKSDTISNKSKYKAVIFDLDGTLFDNFGAMDKSLIELYENTKAFKKLPFDRFKNLYENIQDKFFDMYRVRKLTWKEQRICRMKSLYSHFDIALDDDEAYEKFLEYLSLYESHWDILDNAHDLLDWLQKSGYKIGMITNGEINQQIKKMKSQDIHEFFDCIIASSEYDFAKPDKRIFDIALKEMGIKNTQALYIGDSIRSDIRGAYNANIHSVFISREHNKHYKIAFNPTYIINNLDEILPILESDRKIKNED